MLTEERMEEIEYDFWNESNDPETQEWRDYLTEEEKNYVKKKDQNFYYGLKSIATELKALIKND